MEVAMRKPIALIAVALAVVLAVIALLENRQSAAQTTSMPNAFQDVPRVQKWEYKTIRPDLTTEMEPGARSELNQLGAEGWELCESVRTDGMPFLIFKRPGVRGRAPAGNAYLR
jgi:hypothetical protein